MSDELDYTRELVASAIYAPDHYIDVITLVCAATYRVDDFFNACRLLFLGKKGSGKSRGLIVASYLADNCGPPTGVKAMTAPSYVTEYRMARELEEHWTPAIDEVNHLFGEAGVNGKSSKFYTYLNQGYLRDTAFAQHQENRVRMRIPIFGFAFLAGLGVACPDDLRDRAIILRMEKAPPDVNVADFSDPEVRAAFRYGGKVLASWAASLPRLSTTSVKGLHPELNHRRMEIWGPLFAVAKAASDEWVKRALIAFDHLELNRSEPVYSPETQLILDYLKFAEDREDVEEGVASGEFAQFCYAQEHGAYAGKQPGQFKQWVVGILGPTKPFYRKDTQGMVRGWGGTLHTMNLDRARRIQEKLDSEDGAASDVQVKWEDF